MRDFTEGRTGFTTGRSLGIQLGPLARLAHGTAIGRVLPAVGLALALLPAQPAAATPLDTTPGAASPVAASPAAPPAAAAPAAAPDAAAPDTGERAEPAKPAESELVGTAHSDPLEKTNRQMYSISNALDRAVVGPVTHAYIRVTPEVIRNRISAFIYNLGEPRTALNDVLQGRPKPAGRAVARLVVNSTVGVGGLFDVASRIGVAGHQSDFGQTLGRYGVRPGPYLFVPFLGPSNLRDGLGSVVDMVADPVAWATGGLDTTFAGARGGVTTLDTRAQADSAIHALDDSIDPYATVRSAFLQLRAAAVDEARGRAPTLPDFDEPASLAETSRP